MNAAGGFSRIAERNWRSMRMSLKLVEIQLTRCWTDERRALLMIARSSLTTLDRFARQPLTNHVELVEVRIMERHDPAHAVICNLDLQAQQIAQLTLERRGV